VEEFGRRQQKKLDFAEIKRIYLGWEIYTFIVPYTLVSSSFYRTLAAVQIQLTQHAVSRMVAACHTATSYFNLWLKAEGYSVVKTNYLPTGGNALAIVVTILVGMLADRSGQYYWILIFLQGLMIFANILLSVWTIPKAALMFSYYISYAGSASTPVLIVSCISHHSDLRPFVPSLTPWYARRAGQIMPWQAILT
jgi:MFS transporter, ACS family, pantothenate transporter